MPRISASPRCPWRQSSPNSVNCRWLPARYCDPRRRQPADRGCLPGLQCRHAFPAQLNVAAALPGIGSVALIGHRRDPLRHDRVVLPRSGHSVISTFAELRTPRNEHRVRAAPVTVYEARAAGGVEDPGATPRTMNARRPEEYFSATASMPAATHSSLDTGDLDRFARSRLRRKSCNPALERLLQPLARVFSRRTASTSSSR